MRSTWFIGVRAMDDEMMIALSCVIVIALAVLAMGGVI
jgi:hypothetical protein